MNIQKAIEIKLQWRKDNYPPALADELNADMLAIEALKRRREPGGRVKDILGIPLPGETKD